MTNNTTNTPTESHLTIQPSFKLTISSDEISLLRSKMGPLIQVQYSYFMLAAWLIVTGTCSCTAAFQSQSHIARPFLHGTPNMIFATSTLHASASTTTTTTSKAGARFDAMLANFRQHSSADINLVPSLRFRGLLTGVSAAINDEKVTEAFRVLYEDLGPVRVGGDLMFSKLERELVQTKATDAAETVRALGREDSCVVAARKIFDAVDADASGTVSSRELLDSDLLRSMGQCADCTCEKKGNCQSVASFMDEIDKTHPEGELHFNEFLVAAHYLLYEGDASVSLFGGDDAADELVDQLLSNDNAEGNGGDGGKARADRHAKRFDAMCEEFDSWESGGDGDSSVMSRAQERNPRLALVLEGCFAGAKQPPVVDALKILYMDFLPLRMAGDLIFKLMRKLAR